MKIKIDERDYLELVEQSLYAQALDGGGVDNWTWYSTALQDFIQVTIDEDSYMEEYFKSIGKITQDGILDDLDIKDLAEYYINIVKESQAEEEAFSN